MRQLRLSIILIALPAFPQLLYNEGRDKQAQEALKLSGEIQNSQVFQKALDNLDELWKLRQDRVFRNAEQQMEANLIAFRTWEDIQKFTSNLKQRLGPADSPELPKRLSDLKEQETKTLAALADLKKKLAAAPNAVAAINRLGKALEDIGKVDPVVEFAMSHAGSDAEQAAAAKQAEGLLKDLAAQYKAFSLSLPAQPSVLALQDDIAVLRVQEDHAQKLIAIEQRKQKEIAPIRRLLNDVDNGLAGTNNNVPCLSPAERSQPIADVLQRKAQANDDICLQFLTFALINAAALTARNDTPVRLAFLRSTMEDRANALRISQARTQQIEELIANGVQRLAIFHKGGIKPENLAQLLQALATAGIAPAIVLK